MADGSDRTRRLASLFHGALLMADAAERARPLASGCDQDESLVLARFRYLAASTGALARSRTQFSQDDRALRISVDEENGITRISVQAIGFLNIQRYRATTCLLVSEDANLRHILRFDERGCARLELNSSDALGHALRTGLRLEACDVPGQEP